MPNHILQVGPLQRGRIRPRGSAMGTEIKIWQVNEDKLGEITADSLANDHYEADLEDWIEKDTSLLGSKLLVIGRQIDIPNVGQLDLLCIDENGALVVVELKRDKTN